MRTIRGVDATLVAPVIALLALLAICRPRGRLRLCRRTRWVVNDIDQVNRLHVLLKLLNLTDLHVYAYKRSATHRATVARQGTA